MVDTKGASMGSLAKGGRVPKTANYTLHKGEIVMNKTQQGRLRKAKTQKGKNKVIDDVRKRAPKKPKGAIVVRNQGFGADAPWAKKPACARKGGCGGAKKTKGRKRTPAQKKAFEKNAKQDVGDVDSRLNWG